MENDLISRQAAIDEIDEWIKAFRENGHKESAADACLIQDGIIQLPSAQSERKEGIWINAYISGVHHLRCSECGTYIEATFFANDYDVNFCPKCGEKMKNAEK